MKIINKRKTKLTLSMLALFTALSLTGCSEAYGITPVPLETDEMEVNVIPETLETEEIDYYSFQELEDIHAYLVYTVDNNYVFYDAEFLKRVETDDYVAYYKATDGYLVSVHFKNPETVDRFKYKSYMKKDVIELGSITDELYREDLSDTIKSGLDYDNQTITKKAYTFLELGYISRNTNVVSEEVDEIELTKELKR